MATSKDYRLGEYTFPRGWFMIADSEELNTHKPLAVRFFGKDFALYRGRATGKVVKAGRRVVVTTAEVVHIDANGKSSPCAVMQQTLAPVPRTY